MSLLVVGSVAFDGIETPHGKRDRMLGGAASYFALAACHFTPVRVVGIVGDDFTAKDMALAQAPQHRSDRRRTRHGKNILLGRALQPEHERADNAGDGAERLREFSSHAAAVVHRFAVYFSRQHRSRRCSARS